MADPAPRRRTRIHWPALVVVLLSLAAALGLHGYVTGELADAGTVRPPGPADQVPASVTSGGPIIGAHAGTLDSLRMPAKTVALTFDDGPDPTWTPQVLDVLRREHVPGTFFLLGSQTLRYPDLVRRELREGHEIGNHSFRHPDLTNQPVWEQRWQLAQQELALVGVTGRTTSLMRPPYSFSADSVDNKYWQLIQDAHTHGYITVLADVDARDWERPGVGAIVRNAIPKDGRGAVILLHDAGGDRSQTVAALGVLIPRLRAMGYRFTTIGDAAHVAPYTPASSGELWRGRALLYATEGSQVVATVFAAAFLIAGALTLIRLLLMVVAAHRHRRSRRSSSWGPPVTAPVSVVVPAYNEKEGIEAAIRSIVDGDHPVEVVVVDDGSTDGTADLVEALGLPQVTLIRQENAGKPAALNAGIRAARHDILVLVDGDTRFERETVRRLVQPMADSRVGAVSGNAKVGNRRGLLGRWQHVEYVMGFNLDRRLYDVLRCMPTVPGAVGAFRRAALVDVGGVSEDTLAEDTDLTAAVVRAGWRVVYEETARAWTEAPSSWGQLWKQRYRWCYGTLQAMWKHRRAIVERGDSGRFGRRGLLAMLLFQVMLPLTAPAMDAFLLYGLLFLDLRTTVLLWGGFLGAQLADGHLRVPARPRVAVAAVVVAAAAGRLPAAHVPRGHPVDVHGAGGDAPAVGEAAPDRRRAAAVRGRRAGVRAAVVKAAAVGLLVTVLAACGTGPALPAPSPPTPPPSHPVLVVAPWVDVTASRPPDLAAVARRGVTTVNLGFVTAAGGACQPAWGGARAIGDAAVAQLVRGFRAAGGDVRVSFGGADGVELARACSTSEALAAAYAQVVDALGVRLIDLDVEGATLADAAAVHRRDEALRRLAAGARARGRPLRISFTLPAEPTGLTPAGRRLLQDAHDEGVPVDAVDVLAMDYAGDPGDLVAAAQAAAEATGRLVAALWPGGAVGVAATVMIGVSDVPGQVLPPADARRIADLAAARHLAWLGFWSLGRDRPCPPGEAGSAGRANARCSGVPQQPGAYLEAFTRPTGPGPNPAPDTAPAG